MTSEEMQETINKLRVQIKANPEVAARFSDAMAFACEAASIAPPKEFFEGLVIAHQGEQTTFSVPVLPVGSQCGLA